MDDCHMFTLTSADGTSLFARHWPATGPRATMLLIHGFGEHSGRYGPMGTHLADNGVQVLAVDLRGHGRSDGPRGVIKSYDDYRQDLSAALMRARELHDKHTSAPNAPLILYGHSMGGGIVLDHGLYHPDGVDGIIASGPLIKPKDPIPAPLELMAKTMAKVKPKATLKNAISGAQISTLPAEQAAYEADALNHNRLGFRLALDMIAAGETIAQRAKDWRTPLLLMHARGDQLTDFSASEQFAKDAQSVTFRPLDSVEHEIHNDKSRAIVYRSILDFIKPRS